MDFVHENIQQPDKCVGSVVSPGTSVSSHSPNMCTLVSLDALTCPCVSVSERCVCTPMDWRLFQGVFPTLTYNDCWERTPAIMEDDTAEKQSVAVPHLGR